MRSGKGISLKYTLDDGIPGVAGISGMPAAFEPPAVDPNAPSLATALQEQLGLELEGARARGGAVIDRFETPTLD